VSSRFYYKKFITTHGHMNAKVDAIVTRVVVYLELYRCSVLYIYIYIYICTYFAFISSFNFLNNLKSNINFKKPLFFSVSLGMPQMLPGLSQDGQTFSVLHSVQPDSGVHLASCAVDFAGLFVQCRAEGHDV